MTAETIVYRNLDEVPESIHQIYRTDTMFGVIFGDFEFAVTALRAGVHVEVWRKHRTRGWERN